MKPRRENQAPAHRISEGQPSAGVRERPRPSATSGERSRSGLARSARTSAETQKRDGAGTRLRESARAARALVLGVEAGLPESGDVPAAVVRKLLQAVEEQLLAGLEGGAP